MNKIPNILQVFYFEPGCCYFMGFLDVAQQKSQYMYKHTHAEVEREKEAMQNNTKNILYICSFYIWELKTSDRGGGGLMREISRNIFSSENLLYFVWMLST